jgi:trimeric autotransporter adhesin
VFAAALSIFATPTDFSSAAEFSPHLIKDVNSTGSDSSSPSEFSRAGDFVFFSASDPLHGVELWKTDGTADGTALVKDINPGTGDSDPGYLVAIGNSVFFCADDGVHGLELWKSDGTVEGTTIVKDITPGSEGNLIDDLAKVGDTLFFSARAGLAEQLWKSDGTGPGTTLVADLYPKPHKSTRLDEFTNVDGTLFFTFSPPDELSKRELWRSDGTTAGTIRLANNDARELMLAGDTLFFLGGSNLTELWTTDGTIEGTAFVKEVDSLSPYRKHMLTALGGILYFVGNDNAYGRELWRSDGTEAGTFRLTDLGPGVSDSGISALTEINGTLFVLASDLWKIEGSSQDLELVSTLPGSGATLVPLGEELILVAGGGWIWRSNGTDEGTYLVTKIEDGIDLTHRGGVAVLGEKLLLNARDALHGYELWASDGTANGTRLVKDIDQSGGSLPRAILDLNGTLFFNARDPINGQELWKSDGTEEGTVLVADIRPGAFGSFPWELTAVGNTLYFAACGRGASDLELWRSDGSMAGTQLVKDIRPGPAGSQVSNLLNMHGTLYFTANDGVHGRELWKSDGTEEGTVLVRDIQPGSAGSNVDEITASGDTLYFRASDGMSGDEVWKSDGTEAGTTLLKDINPGAAGSPGYESIDFDFLSTYLYEFTSVGQTVYFTADDGSGKDLWKTNGTTKGTVLVKDFPPSISSWVHSLIMFDGAVYFNAAAPEGSGLWRSDGTTKNTTFVSANKLGMPTGCVGCAPVTSNATRYTMHNGALFAAAQDGVVGSELWMSDGASLGSGFVRDIYPGAEGSSPTVLTSIGDSLLFTATDGVNGRELWQSDGTFAGTHMLSDIAPGAIGGLDYGFDIVKSGGTVFFAANDLVNGIELWGFDLRPAPSPALPVNMVVPLLSGSAEVGETLSCSTGIWENSPTEYAYSWLRNDDPIAGEAASTYTVQGADAGHAIWCEVTATNGTGSVSEASNALVVPTPESNQTQNPVISTPISERPSGNTYNKCVSLAKKDYRKASKAAKGKSRVEAMKHAKKRKHIALSRCSTRFHR